MSFVGTCSDVLKNMNKSLKLKLNLVVIVRPKAVRLRKKFEWKTHNTKSIT